MPLFTWSVAFLCTLLQATCSLRARQRAFNLLYKGSPIFVDSTFPWHKADTAMLLQIPDLPLGLASCYQMQQASEVDYFGCYTKILLREVRTGVGFGNQYWSSALGGLNEVCCSNARLVPRHPFTHSFVTLEF